MTERSATQGFTLPGRPGDALRLQALPLNAISAEERGELLRLLDKLDAAEPRALG